MRLLRHLLLLLPVVLQSQFQLTLPRKNRGSIDCCRSDCYGSIDCCRSDCCGSIDCCHSDLSFFLLAAVTLARRSLLR